MAELVLGLAASRSPMLSIPPALWDALGDRDRTRPFLLDAQGDPITYDELLAGADPRLADELSAATTLRKYQATQQRLEQLAEKLVAVHPDVVVVMGDDEQEIIDEDNRPALLVYWGETFRVVPRPDSASLPTVDRAGAWTWGAQEGQYQVPADLARHIIERLIDDGFDVAHANRLPWGKGISHAFGFVIQRLMTHWIYPIVPILMNVHYPPNQPTPTRCFKTGQAVRRAIEAWPKDIRVAVIGTGGLSVGIVQEEMDRKILSALAERDLETIGAVPTKWLVGPNAEVRNWISTAGAAEHLEMELLEYVPAYRSPAGTGCGMAFAWWT